MKAKTIVDLMHQQASKLVGKISAFDKYKDKTMLCFDVKEIIDKIDELNNELGKVLESDKNN